MTRKRLTRNNEKRSLRGRVNLNSSNETNDTSRVQVARAAGIIALGNVASRILGLVRETVKANLFGAGGNVSALDTAMSIPVIIYDLLVGGMISSALIPVLSDYATPEHRTEMWHVLSIILNAICLLVSALLVAGELFTPQIIRLSAGGLSAADQALASNLLRLMLPGVLFLSLASVLSGALYALNRFTLPAFTPAIFNVAVVIVALVLGRRWGVYSMAVGLLIGSILQVALQLPGLRDVPFTLTFDLRHPALRRIGRLYLPILIGLTVDKLAELLSYRLASHTGAASISWMKYSATMIQLPLGLVVTAISIAILPTLSRQANEAQPGPFKTTLAQGLRLVLTLTIPATIGLWVLAHPIIALVFEHGDFSPVDTMATVAALRCHLVGLIFAAIDQPLIFAFYARKDTWTPALVGVLTVILYVILNAIPILFASLTLNLLILANSIKWAVHALMMLILMQRAIGGLHGHDIWQVIVKGALASAVMGGLVYLFIQVTTPLIPQNTLGEFILVGGGGFLGIAIYAVLSVLLGIRDVATLWHAIVRWYRGLKASLQ
ncbi:MAG TPA: murein biosynthesis integral membrane protein MurJ [Chloroflexi bacterium]|nr:murein biosynthesis integral membrane protein MurJ [Chloroflexota bacterium]